MTTPTPALDLSNILPRSVVLQPAWNEQVARVMPDFQDTRTSNPEERVWIPPGVTIIRITSDTRFAITVKYLRDGNTRELGVMEAAKGARFEISSEKGTEMWFEFSGTPNTSDRAYTRVGVRIQPMGKAQPTI